MNIGEIEAWCHREMTAIADSPVYLRAEAILRLLAAHLRYETALRDIARHPGGCTDGYSPDGCNGCIAIRALDPEGTP